MRNLSIWMKNQVQIAGIGVIDQSTIVLSLAMMVYPLYLFGGPLVGLRVTVKDMNGMVVYSNVLSITGGDKVVLDLDVVGGEFLLILNDNSRCLYGIFSLT